MDIMIYFIVGSSRKVELNIFVCIHLF